MFRLVLQSKKHVSFLGMLAFLTLCSVPMSAANIVFSSGPNWDVFNVDPVTPGAVPLGPAQRAFCPGGIVCWSADLSTIPGATWMWGQWSPSTPSDLKQFFFSKTFVLGDPVSGTISVAVDDFAQVFVNGINAGTTGSISDVAAASAAQSEVVTFDISSFLKPGSNIVTVFAQNGPAWFPGAGVCPTEGCTYGMNPAGVVFGGSLSDVSANTPEPESAALGCVGALVLALCGITRRQWLNSSCR
jgi:hypothetical protein